MKKLALLISTLLLISTTLALTVTQNVSVNVLNPLNVTVLSPVQGSLYGSRQVLISIIYGIETESLQFSDNGAKFRQQCSHCDSYHNKKPFDNGFHELVIKSVSPLPNQDVLTYINFTVDTKNPSIRKTEPRNGFATGLFSVEFQEENPTSLSINYGNDAIGFRNSEVDLGTCLKDRSDTICETQINISDYDSQEIAYWFNLTDIMNNSDSSRKREIEVDTSPPIITFFNYTKDGRYIKFLANITELHFEEATYIDNSDSRPRERTLCSRLRHGACEKRRSFSSGEHNLTLKFLDDAGNFALIEEVTFLI